jgi:hypothetical protein
MKTRHSEKESDDEQIPVAGAHGNQSHRHSDEEHQNCEDSAASKAIRQHSYRNARQCP